MQYIISWLIALLFCIYIISKVGSNSLDFFDEAGLQQLLMEEKNVMILLMEDEKCSEQCLQLQEKLLDSREDLVEYTESWIVKSHAPKFVEEFDLKVPSILFMRDGRPLVFEESDSPEGIVEYFQKNKISAVHNLTDSTFEHETQSATGATTGDWLVLFTRDSCPECRKFLPTIEAAGAQLKGQKNVAIVQREHAPVSARRFGIKTFPSVALFRLGHMYRYTSGTKKVAVLTAFAKDTFRNAKKEKVPLPKSPFDDLIESIVDWIRENPWSFLGGALGAVAAVAFVILLNIPPPESWAKKNKKKRN